MSAASKSSPSVAPIEIPLPSGASIRVIYHEIPNSPFSGNKLQHPFRLEEMIETTIRRGKQVSSRSSVYGSFTSPEAEAQLLSTLTRFFVKFDGSCGEVLAGVPRRRHDLEIIKNTDNPVAKVGERFELLSYAPCEERPVIPEGASAKFHWPHMRDVVLTDKVLMGKTGDKWFADAAQNFLASVWFQKFGSNFPRIPGEWMGPKIQLNLTDPLPGHTFMPFNMVEFEVPVELRTPKGFREIFLTIPNIEGLVAYCPESIFKVRRDMYLGEDGMRLEWGKSAPVLPKELKEQFDSVSARNFAEFVVKVFGL